MQDQPHRSANQSAHWREIILLRRRLVSLKAQTRLLRYELARKYNPDQPRVPAGNTGGGQWTSGGSGGGATPTGTDVLGDLGSAFSAALNFGDVVADTSGQESWAFYQDATRPDGSLAERAVVNRDGSTIHSEFTTPDKPSDWDERHTVTAPEGGKTTFETSDRTQTIRDGGPDGEIVSRSTWTERGPEREATVQQAFAPAIVLAPAAAEVTITTALTLFTWLSARNKIDGLQAVAGFCAREFQGDGSSSPRLDFVGNLTEQEADRACNRREIVQNLLNEAARDAGSPSNYPNPGAYGSAVHTRVKQAVDLKNDPDLQAEISAFRAGVGRDGDQRYGLRDTHRADVVERASETTACGYDLKTGNAIVSPKRAAELVALMKRLYPNAQRFIIMQMKPRK
ncbi:conserved hypothetical protein [Bosea sp. 62]|uniref:hypothetical protein n=1 Tax=unclassified Bosea (in: a-proteobacteria) TaxID=2653178 RepID=UPI00125AD565|nr:MULTISPECIES: hypothetical protein [unclassified Bosea (in: a-proteobacteria)]CAD5252456.1 conserved hypothetical protein [Bosea sp. 7B]CAD5278967.1 conserved hypothetical protein [Bosea sp. 21B]CAD5280088.1 conserved hypothetical protein [Bosea sp. 46]VVT59592.1 conserved hypothetical protein [Bosea sp. EC-HK365B]VXB35308.1 conserved hypothetical protein [Bosea sp. 62]